MMGRSLSQLQCFLLFSQIHPPVFIMAFEATHFLSEFSSRECVYSICN